jgi:hypothetical protein
MCCYIGATMPRLGFQPCGRSIAVQLEVVAPVLRRIYLILISLTKNNSTTSEISKTSKKISVLILRFIYICVFALKFALFKLTLASKMEVKLKIRVFLRFQSGQGKSMD